MRSVLRAVTVLFSLTTLVTAAVALPSNALAHKPPNQLRVVVEQVTPSAAGPGQTVTLNISLSNAQPSAQPSMQVDINVPRLHIDHSVQDLPASQNFQVSFTVPLDAQPDSYDGSVTVHYGSNEKGTAPFSLSVLPVGALPEVPYPVVLPALLLVGVSALRWAGGRRRAVR
ncbi:MAG: hypothetical protein M0Z66_11360 [Thermaerobacter sp.]|nr:hypothetical protein [Thermaerobacter sp.]